MAILKEELITTNSNILFIFDEIFERIFCEIYKTNNFFFIENSFHTHYFVGKVLLDMKNSNSLLCRLYFSQAARIFTAEGQP